MPRPVAVIAAIGSVAFVVLTVRGCVGASAPQVAVPEIRGTSMAIARQTLEATGLRVGDIHYQEETTGSDGVVLDQSRTPGDLIRAGREVDLTVSGAPAVRVPDLVGDRYDAAAATIDRLGLARGPVQYSDSHTVAKDRVISSSLAADSEVPQGTQVLLVVSTGPPAAAVPWVVESRAENASAFIYHLGFIPIVREVWSAEPPGFVLEQKPDTGTVLEMGKPVILVVSRGPETPRTVPSGQAALHVATMRSPYHIR